MYIKDDSFYEEFRNTTTARMYLLRPSFSAVALALISGTGFLFGDDVGRNSDGSLSIPSGVFERYPPLLSSSNNETLEFELRASTEDFISSPALPVFATGERELYVAIIYAVDDNGIVKAPPGEERVKLIKTTSSASGAVVVPNIVIPASKTGFAIESIHLCYGLPVDPQHISFINHKEKNDIILSSIPYNNIEVELFDEYRTYADFIEAAGKKLRVLLQYQYNEVSSESFIYYYDEDPKYDKSAAVPKTIVKFGGLTDILDASAYVNTAGPYATPFTKKIGTYLNEIATCFRSNFIPASLGYSDIETPYGGDFLKLESHINYGQFGVVEGDELVTENYDHHTRTPADGYTFADAIRLLVNAQCHVMRVKNETITAGPPQYILKNADIALAAGEYFSKPQKEKYANIDQIKVTTSMWTAEAITEDTEPTESHTLIFAFKEGGEEFYMGNAVWFSKRLEYGKPLLVGDVEWVSEAPYEYLYDCDLITAGGAVSVLWKKSALGTVGYVTVTVKGNPFEKSKEFAYGKVFGSGKQVLDLSNPFLRPRDLQSAYDIPDEYIDFNYKYLSGKIIYTLETRGRFDVHPLDRIQFTNDDNELRYGIVIEHNMKFNGAMRSTLRVVDDGPVEALLADDDECCDNILICR